MSENTRDTQSPHTLSKANRSRTLMVLVAGFILIVLVYGLLGRAPVVKIGDPAPAFKVTTREGKEIDSAGLTGQIVVINFFATWCQPCHEEVPDLITLWNEYEGQDVLFLGITYKELDAKVAEFVEQYRIPFPIANDQSNLARRFGVTGVPETYVIGKDGLLKFKQIGPISPATLRLALDSNL